MTTATAKKNERKELIVLTPKQVIEQVDVLFEEKRPGLMDLVGRDPAVVDRLRMLSLHALARPKLMEKLRKADLYTVIEAIRECAGLGLMPIPQLAEGYFVPYWNSDKGRYDIQFQVGYQGLAKLIRNSGRVIDVDANIAYEGDEFDYDEGSKPFVHHKRALRDRGNRLAGYAVAYLPGGLTKVKVLEMAVIEQHRRASKAADDGPWVEWYDAMAQRVPLRELGKFLPKSAQVERALIIEADAEESHAAPPRLVGPAKSVTRIHERLGLTQPAQEEPAEDAEAPGEVEAVEGKDAAASPDLVTEAARVFATDAGASVELDGETVQPDPAPTEDDPDAEGAREYQRKAAAAKAAEPGRMVQCESTSPYGDSEQCRNAQGHEGRHRTSSASWE